jgi:spermidine synthase
VTTDAPDRGRLAFIHVLVFCCGFVTLGAELVASRLLAPYFGTSLVVWASLIGIILIALSAGYVLGGAQADRHPRLSRLLIIISAGAFLLGLVPFLARPVLTVALEGVRQFSFGILIGSFAGVLVLLGVPMLLLGACTPFAVRLATRNVAESGRTAGRLFALSTVGSFLGAFVPTLLLLPLTGTRWTFATFSLILLAVAATGFVLERRRGLAAAAVAAALVVVGLAAATGAAPIKPVAGLVFEAESPYQYVQVVDRPSGWRVLHLNEGVVAHSKYHPDRPLTMGEWDFEAIAPFFNPAPYDPGKQARKWLIIGAGAGTTAKLAHTLFAPDSIVGVELDPVVIETGRNYFHADMPGYTPVVADGRGWLKGSQERFDAIAVDAYRQPYVPFELTTVEFFTEVREHLADTGVVAVNASRPSGDTRLVNALATTMSRVFPSVFLINLPERNMTTVIVATTAKSSLQDFRRNARFANPLSRTLISRALGMVTTHYEESLTLTDDHAPVERLMDLMLVGQASRFKPPKGFGEY